MNDPRTTPSASGPSDITAGTSAAPLDDSFSLSACFGADASKPLLKWPGGKSAELSVILKRVPSSIDRLIEPFVGGGAVFWATKPLPAAINDVSVELMEFYRHAADGSPAFSKALNALADDWHRLDQLAEHHLRVVADLYLTERLRGEEHTGSTRRCDDPIRALMADFASTATSAYFIDMDGLALETHKAVRSKLNRMAKLELKKGHMPDEDVFNNIHGAVKAGFYTQLRAQYNSSVVGQAPPLSPVSAALFFFIREYCYAAMFRYSKSGTFNVPFGGMSYARKPFHPKVSRVLDATVRHRLAQAQRSCADFETFLTEANPGKHDLIFADPPYDSDFSTYGGHSFGPEDQRRLAALMDTLRPHTKIMLVVKATDLILALYPPSRWKVTGYDKTYMWTIKDRNERAATHLMITNG